MTGTSMNIQFKHLILVATSAIILGACDPGVSPPPPATHAVFMTQPVLSVASGETLGTVTIQLLDADGHATRSTATVIMQLASSDTAARLLGTVAASASEGVATFSDLRVARAGTGFHLVAQVPGLDSAVSEAFDVSPGPAAQLRIPINSISWNVYPRCAGDMLPFTVQVTDTSGNVVSTERSVTIALTRTGAFGITLSSDDSVYGTKTRTAVAGVVKFDDLSVHKSGTYALSATAVGLAPATVSGFVGGCHMDRLVFLTQPSDGTAGVALGKFSVLRVDPYGNATSEQHSPGPSYSVTIEMGNNPGSAVLSGTRTVSGAGVSARDFSDISLDKAAAGYTLVARSTSGFLNLTAMSAAFTIRQE